MEELNESSIESDIMIPLSKTLTFERQKLSFSNENFESILLNETNVKELHGKILDLEPYPSLFVLAAMAKEVYSPLKGCIDEREGKNEEQIEKKIYSKGWNLLTTAKSSDGYFGAAFYNKDQKQIVIAHRGTELKNWKSLWADLRGIMNNKYVSLMNSAVTFSHIIKLMIIKLKKENGNNYHLSFTGHSLGGWLAQVTTFTTKYLHDLNTFFIKLCDSDTSLHAHAVVFDSPGCFSMLMKLKKDFDLRYESSMSIDKLDITSYLSAPNMVNCSNLHVGVLYRIFIDSSKMTEVEKRIGYTFYMHKMASILKQFDEKTGQVVKYINGGNKLCEVIDWPIFGRLTESEYSAFFKWANRLNNYHFHDVNEDFKVTQSNIKISSVRYKTKTVDSTSCSLRVFSREEMVFLDGWSVYRKSDAPSQQLNDFAKKIGLSDFKNLIPQFEIKDKKIYCEDGLAKLIGRTKQLVRWFPDDILSTMKWLINMVPNAMDSLCEREFNYFLEYLLHTDLKFIDTLKIKSFIESKQQVFFVQTNDTELEMIRINSILNEYLERMEIEKRKIYLNFKQIKKLESYVDVCNISKSIHDLFVFVHSNSNINVDLFKTILKNFRNYPNKKVIFILPLNSVLTDYVDDNVITDYDDDNVITDYVDDNVITDYDDDNVITDYVDDNVITDYDDDNVINRKIITDKLNLLDFTEESRQEILDKEMLTFYGGNITLRDVFDLDSGITMNESHYDRFKEIINERQLKKLISNENDTSTMFGEDLPSIIKSEITNIKIDSFISKENLVHNLKRNDEIEMGKEKLFMFTKKTGTNLTFEELMKFLNMPELLVTEGIDDKIKFVENEQNECIFYRRLCFNNPDKNVYWLEFDTDSIYCRQIYNLDLHITRNFIYSYELKDGIDIRSIFNSYKDVFVFSNIANESELIEILKLSKINEYCKRKIIFYFSNKNDACKNYETNINDQKDKSIHFFEKIDNKLVWKKSHGNIIRLRKYLLLNENKSMNEKDFSERKDKILLIADEPGKGKSTSLTSLCKLIKSPFVIRIDFRDCQQSLKELPDEINLESVLKFLINYKSKGDTEYLEIILKHCLLNNSVKPIYILFDGFDEIREYDIQIEKQEFKITRLKVTNLIKFLNEKTRAVLRITTRDHRCSFLEESLCTFAIKFQHINDNDRKKFLMNFWLTHLCLSEIKYSTINEKLNVYCYDLFEKARSILGQDILKFASIPLQLRMIAEVSKPKESFFNDDDPDYSGDRLDGPQLDADDLYDLYTIFVNAKLNIYLHDKTDLKSNLTNLTGKLIVESLIKIHRNLSFQLLFPDMSQIMLGDRYFHFDSDEEKEKIFDLSDIGLILSNSYGDYRLVHRTFAEYFTAGLLATWLNKKDGRHPKYPVTEIFLLEHILLRPQYKTIRSFLNYRLAKASFCLSKKGTEKVVNYWLTTKRCLYNRKHETAFHIAVEENHINIIKVLLTGLDITEEYLYIINKRDLNGNTAFFKAIGSKNDLLIDVFLNNVTKSSSDIIEKFILATIFRTSDFTQGETYIKLDSKKIEYTSLESVLENAISKRNLINDFLKKANNDTVNDLKTFLDQVETVNIRSFLLLTTNDQKNHTALHLAVLNDDLDKVKYLAGIMGKNISDVFDIDGMTPLQISVQKGYINIVKYLIEQGDDIDAIDRYDVSVVSRACKRGHFEILKYLIDKGGKINVTDWNGITCLQSAAKYGHLNLVQYLLPKFSKESLNKADYFGMRAISWPAKTGHVDIVKFLKENGADINCLDRYGKSVTYIAVANAKWDIVKYLVMEGAKLNVKNNVGVSEFQETIKARKLDVVELMLQKGATMCEDDKNKICALIKNVKNFWNLLEMLLKNGVDISEYEYKSSIFKYIFDERFKKNLEQTVEYLVTLNNLSLLNYFIDCFKTEQYIDESKLSTSIKNLILKINNGDIKTSNEIEIALNEISAVKI